MSGRNDEFLSLFSIKTDYLLTTDTTQLKADVISRPEFRIRKIVYMFALCGFYQDLFNNSIGIYRQSSLHVDLYVTDFLFILLLQTMFAS